MRQRVKRRLFLLSMALATGASCPAFAKGGGKAGSDGHAYADDRLGTHFTSFPEDVGENEVKPPVLLGKLKHLLGSLSHSPDVAPPASGTKDWRLELLPPDARSDPANAFRPEKARRLGITVRVPF